MLQRQVIPAGTFSCFCFWRAATRETFLTNTGIGARIRARLSRKLFS